MDSIRRNRQDCCMKMTIEDIIAREEIRACIARVARGEDRRDALMIESSFCANARLDFGVFAGAFADYLSWVIPGSEAISNTQHQLGQSHIELCGDTALVETQVTSYHRIDYGAGEEHDVVIGGRYLDRLTLREGSWRIASRTMLYDWHQDWGKSVDWSQGLLGMQFSAPHFSGRAKGDWSMDFFNAD
jgi:hypothetical protein